MICINVMKLVCFIFTTVILPSQCIDVSWIPSDVDPPLPLSSRYRESLKKLCIQISTGKSLHPDIENKKDILNKMCAKLQRDEGYLSSPGSSSYVPWLCVVVVLCIIAYFGIGSISQYYSRLNIQTSSSSQYNDSAMREARVRKFTAQGQAGKEE